MDYSEKTAAYNLAEQKLKGKQADLTHTLTPNEPRNFPKLQDIIPWPQWPTQAKWPHFWTNLTHVLIESFSPVPIQPPPRTYIYIDLFLNPMFYSWLAKQDWWWITQT